MERESRIQDLTRLLLTRLNSSSPQGTTDDNFSELASACHQLLGALEQSQKKETELRQQIKRLGEDLAKRSTEKFGQPGFEETLVKNTLDKMLEGMQIISFDWRYLYVNDALVLQGRFPREQLMGRTMMEIYPGLEHTDVFAHLKECMDGRISKHIETEFTFPDMSKAWFEISVQPVPEGIVILSVDITSRKEAESKLRASEQEYRSLIEQATDGIFIADAKGKYLDVNESACKMLKYSKEELLQKHMTDIMTPEDVATQPPRLDELHNGKAILSQRNLIRKDGSIIPVEINGKVLANGKILGLVRDITERKEAEESLRLSEEKFRKLTETAFDAIVLANEEGNITYWNKGAELMFGYTQEEVINYSLQRIMPSEYHSAHDAGMKRYLTTKQPKVIGKVVSLTGQRKNGERFPIEISITTWEGRRGKMFSGIIRDSSERKAWEAKIRKLNEELEQKVHDRTHQLNSKINELKESEEKFNKAFHGNAAAISITKISDSTYLDINESFELITGYTRDEIIGKSEKELNITTPANSSRSDQNQNIEGTLRNRMGKSIAVLSSSDIIYLQGERYSINILYDISDRKRAEEKLENLNKELESFSYSVSHDLRAPLRSIIGYSKIIEEDYLEKFEPESKRLFNIIARNASRMNSLIDDLLEFSRMSKRDLNKESFDMAALVKHVIENSSTNPRATLSTHGILDTVSDPSLLTIVWTNLISNAIKYSEKVEFPKIDIGSNTDGNENIYYIRDNGTGFDMQYANKLFQVFQRLHRYDEFAGTGIGLSIVKRIIERHGGRVWAEGKVNEGATFYFALPADE